MFTMSAIPEKTLTGDLNGMRLQNSTLSVYPKRSAHADSVASKNSTVQARARA
jgi:hypothetical protein